MKLAKATFAGLVLAPSFLAGFPPELPVGLPPEPCGLVAYGSDIIVSPSASRTSERSCPRHIHCLHRREPLPWLQLLDRGRDLEGTAVIKGVPDDLHALEDPAAGEPCGRVHHLHPVADVDRHRHMRLPVVVESQPSHIAVRTLPADSACVDRDPIEVAGGSLQP